ncbi:FAD-dependent oxidoreductase domain-containing protein 1-like [Glandiceps talaboti]
MAAHPGLISAVRRLGHHRTHLFVQASRHMSIFKKIGNFKKELKSKNPFGEIDLGPSLGDNHRPPDEVDIVVVGGGIIGSSIAYFLKKKLTTGMRVLVVEKDPTYSKASSKLSIGGIHQQFSLPENIQMSMYGAEFLRTIKENLMVHETEPPDVLFNSQGHLFLATQEGAQNLINNCMIQAEHGVQTELMSPTQLKDKFPWLNTEGIEVGSYGIEREGWFDSVRLLHAFQQKAISLGVNYVHGEVSGFLLRHRQVPRDDSYDFDVDYRIRAIKVSMPNSPEVIQVPCAIVVNATGPHAADLARLLMIGVGEGELAMPVPIEPRKRFAYVINSPNGPGLDCPMLVDPTGMRIRRDGLGGNYICTMDPAEEDEPSTGKLNVDHDWFESKIQPTLLHRIPALKNFKMKTSWAGYIDYNTIDQSPIMSRHPVIPNFFLATGFGIHGVQQAPAVGRAMMELLTDGAFVSIDLTKFDFLRFLNNDKISERKVI